MKLTNYHTHSHFCDGASAPEDYVKAAIDKGFDALGFSSHAPLPFINRWAIKRERLDEYTAAIRSLQKKYADQIRIYLGLEVDHIPGMSKGIQYFKEEYGLDYTIGGIHLVRAPGEEKLWFIDGAPEGYDVGLLDIFNMDIQKAVRCYFEQLWDMILTQKPDVIAHFDKIKMNNRGLYFSTDDLWYRRLIDKTIDVIAGSGQIVEVNTRGIYKKRSEELYPALWIVERLIARNVPLTLSADAHHPSELCLHFPETLRALKALGCRHLMVFNGSGWQPEKISSKV